MQYDILIVGSGLFGATVAERAVSAGKKCLILERRGHIGGNVYTEPVQGIQVHKYGAHIFHTNDDKLWKYIGQFAEFNNFINSPLANYKGKLYNLPFNMNTFYQMWGVTTPHDAQEKIEESRGNHTKAPENLEEMAINLVGRDIYEVLIKGYTEKQWGRKCIDLPPQIITRLPLRFTFDNNYFNAKYQGIPIGGYTNMVNNMLNGADIVVGADYLADKSKYDKLAKCIVYTGSIDEFYGYRFGALAYRSVHFESEVLDIVNYQGVAVMNYTDGETPFTRVIEHKHFEPSDRQKTVISREYSREWAPGIEPYYPIESAANLALYKKYANLAQNEEKVYFGGRLGTYSYLDMDKTVELALVCADMLCSDTLCGGVSFTAT